MASDTGTGEIALAIEQCQCGQHYEGLSCEVTADFITAYNNTFNKFS